VFAFSCKQANDGDLGQEKPTPTPSNEVTITVQGDDGVIIKTPNTIKFRKNSTWKEIKEKIINKITTKKDKEIKEWRLKDAKGAVLKDADAFEKDTVIFAVSKDKEKPTPPTNPITITIEVDEGYTFKETTKPCTIEVQKGSAWSSIKEKAEAKIELKDGYEKTGWKLGSKDGSYLADSTLFNENALIFATSKKKGEPDKPKIIITVKGDEGVEVSSHGNFTVDSGAKWESIKAQAVAIASVKECFEITTWHLNNADGVLINDETEFKANTIVFAVSKRKVVQYKVVHAQENIENDEYTAKETEEKQGEAGKNTVAEAKQYEGFSCQGLAQVAIKADGSTVVQIKYKRNRVSLILDLAGGKTTPALEDGEDGKKLLKGKFEARVEVKGLEKENHGFEKWEPTLPSTFPATNSATIYTAKWTKDSIIITVEGDENIDIGTPDTMTVGKGVKWVDIKTQAEEKAKAKEDFEIKEWHLNNADGTLIKDETEFKANTIVFAVSKRKVVQYKVEHLKENIENEEYTKVEEETKTGEAGKNTDAKAKQYEGFSCQGLAQVIIKADSTTAVQIKYKRNRVSIILDLQGGKTTTALENGEGNKKLLKGKFEAEVSIESPTKDDHSFEKWEPALPNTFPAKDDAIVYTAKWGHKTVYRVMIKGDERVKVASPEYIEVPIDSNKTFENIKNELMEKVSLVDGWSTEDYCFYDWRINEYAGKKIEDSTLITENIVIYARTNYKRFTLASDILKGYEGEKPRGKIIIPSSVVSIANGCFTNCDKITAIDFKDCIELKSIGDKLGSAFNGCANIKNIDLSSCTKIENVNLSCENLADINLQGCDDLKDLNLSGGTKLSKIELKDFSKLESVNLSGCTGLEGLGDHFGYGCHTAFSGCDNLKDLNLSGCTKLANISLSCENLINLNLIGCTELCAVYLNGCKSLTELNLSGYRKLRRVDLESLSKLESVNLSNCTALKYFYGINGFSDIYNRTKIKKINLSGCIELEDLKLSGLDTLESINLSGCTELLEIDLGGKTITKLDLSNFTKLSKLKLFCENLRNLNLLGCTELTEISLRGCYAITDSDLSICTNLKSVSFEYCEKLKTANLSGCSELIGIDLTGCDSIMDLNLSGCSKLRNLLFPYSGESSCENLKNLNLQGCTELTEIILRGCYAITDLDLSSCTKLTSIDLSDCISMTDLDLSCCTRLREIDLRCENLKNLNLQGCTELRELTLKHFKEIIDLDLSTFTKLEELNLSCEKLKNLNLQGCTELTEIILSGCKEIIDLDFSGYTKLRIIGLIGLNNLKSLNLSGCTEIEIFGYSGHSNIYECDNLKDLNLSGCTKLKELNLSCEKLKNLNLQGCTELTEINLSNCNSITDLDFSGYTKLKNLALSCENLKNVNLQGCTELYGIYLNDCKEIIDLDFSGCTKLKKLALSCEKLKNLNLQGCTELTGISLSGCKEIIDLDLSSRAKLYEIELRELNKLESVNLSGCTELYRINLVCENLRNLNLLGCTELTEIRLGACKGIIELDLSSYTKLEKLNLSCENLKNLNLQGCTELTKIKLSDCKEIIDLDLSGYTKLRMVALESLNKLETVNLSGCTVLESTDSSISSCASLKDLNLSGCTQLDRINLFCENLRNLNLLGCTELTEISLRGCKAIVDLDLSEHTKLTKVDLYHLDKLETINLSGCTALESIKGNPDSYHTDIDECANLKDINLSGCSKLTSIYLVDFNKLESINLSGCTALESIGDYNNFISSCANLKEINLSGCTKLKSIALKDFSKLESVNLSGCTGLEGIGDGHDNAFSGCNNLKDINLSDCTKLSTVKLSFENLKNLNLLRCTALSEIELRGCKGITELDLSNYKKLNKLGLSCEKLKNLNLLGCTALTEINLRGCKTITDLDLSECTKLANIRENAFYACLNLVLKLPLSITNVGNNAFGNDENSYCKKVLVPNEQVKKLVIDSAYPSERVETY